jgi:hypothetical protein
MTRLIDRGIFCVFCEEKRSIGILFDEAGKVAVTDSGGISVCMECFRDDAVIDRARALQEQQQQPVDTKIIDDIESCNLCNKVADLHGIRVTKVGEIEDVEDGEAAELLICSECQGEDGLDLWVRDHLARRGEYNAALERRLTVKEKLDSALPLRMTKEMREQLQQISKVVGKPVNKVVVAMIEAGIRVAKPRPPKKLRRRRPANKAV